MVTVLYECLLYDLMTEQFAANFSHRHYSGQIGREQTDSRKGFFIDWQNKREEQMKLTVPPMAVLLSVLGHVWSCLFREPTPVPASSQPR